MQLTPELTQIILHTHLWTWTQIPLGVKLEGRGVGWRDELGGLSEAANQVRNKALFILPYDPGTWSHAAGTRQSIKMHIRSRKMDLIQVFIPFFSFGNP